MRAVVVFDFSLYVIDKKSYGGLGLLEKLRIRSITVGVNHVIIECLRVLELSHKLYFSWHPKSAIRPWCAAAKEA